MVGHESMQWDMGQRAGSTSRRTFCNFSLPLGPAPQMHDATRTVAPKSSVAKFRSFSEGAARMQRVGQLTTSSGWAPQLSSTPVWSGVSLRKESGSRGAA